MAISGSFYGTTGNSAIKPKITWSAVQSIEGNYSDVTATLSYSRTDSYKTYGYWAGSLTINDDQKSVSGKYLEITKNSNTVAITHTVRVPHNDDGSKTITISAAGSISGTTLTKTTISGTVTLTGIPRAASIAATDADIGSVSMVTIGKKSDIYTYTVAWKFGSLSGYLSENGISTAVVHVTASSLAFPLPESFYYEIPEAPSDICTLTCTTFLDGAVIGSPQQCSFTVRADPARCAPVLTAAAEDINSATLALTGDKNTLIRYASTALCSMTVQTRFGASITKRRIAGTSVSGNTLTLEKVETDTVTFAVTDSRGYTTETTLALELLPYFTPTLRVSAARTDATSGTAQLQVSGSFYNGDFGLTANMLRLQYQLGDQTVEVQPEIDGNQFALQLPLQDLDYTQAYSVSVTVADSISTETATAKINPGIPVFDWGKGDFAFHVPVSMSGNVISDISDPIVSGDAVNLGYVQGEFLKISGNQTLNGNLSIEGNASANGYFSIYSADNYPRLVIRDAEGKTAARLQVNATTHQMGLQEYCPDNSGYREIFYLPAPENRTANAEYRILTTKTHRLKDLWENASPGSTFAAQTITIDLSGYDAVVIFYRNASDSTVYLSTGIIPIGYKTSLNYVTTGGTVYSRVATVNSDGIVFENGASGSTSGAKYGIPLTIYGFKGVF